MKVQIGEPARSGLVFIRARVEAQVVFSMIGVASQTPNITIPKNKIPIMILPPVFNYFLNPLRCLKQIQ